MQVDNINPCDWGKYYWKVLHYTTLSYPHNPTIETIEKTKQFISLFGELLPCLKCRVHFQENIKIFPLTDEILLNKDKFILWGFNLHNHVNSKLNKSVVSFSTFMNEYNSKSNTKKIITYIL